ncbi:MAG: hypothetical protein SF066_00340 [Thermoanaerobaculia bacterium]|nr:hypothetical protein [Thermoanaerobaculia bacterium]
MKDREQNRGVATPPNLEQLLVREDASRDHCWPYEPPYVEACKWRREPPRTDLVGLGLSGGGIRSATFNLGLLQGLAGLGLLGLFDYLATVSGGGYIGSFWSAWRKQHAGKDVNEFPKNGTTDHEPPELLHLRRFGNFLRPRLQWLSFETGRFVAALVGGLVPALLAALATLAAGLLLFLAAVWLLTQDSAFDSRGNGVSAAFAFFWLSLLTQLGFEWVWLKHRQEEEAARAAPAYAACAIAASFVGAGLWWLVWSLLPTPAVLLLTPAPTGEFSLVAGGLLAPAAVWLVLVFMLVFARTIRSRSEEQLEGRRFLGAFDRVLSRFGLLAVLWSVAAVAWLLGSRVAEVGVAGVLSAVGVAGASGSAFTWLRRFLPSASAPTSGETAGRRLKPWLLTGLAFVTIVALGILISAGLAEVSLKWSTDGLLVTAGAVLGLLGGALLFFDPHGVSFHSFYRARLVRAYLGATNPERSLEAAECAADDFPVDKLPTGKPFHLICCAANDLAGDSLKTLHRGAESAVISRSGLQVGGRWRPWRRGELSLGAAMTASGSAFNSHMGNLSMELGWPVTFLLTAFNLRLGRWVPGVDGAVKTPPRWPGWFFFRELFGQSRTGGDWEFLSDGAHFDNLGLYELVRRHCRYILISDCGADPDVAFDDLGNAIRRVREDFGVEIELDTTPLRPKGPERRAERPMVAGEIRYPAGDRGILLYIKPTLTGDEPSDVAQYAQRNKVFPHETTLDQFFDEAQWESYRRLGEHVVTSAFQSLGAVAARRGQPVTDASLLFAQARISWRPPPRDDSDQVKKLREQWAELEQAMWDNEDGRALLAEVYPPVWQTTPPRRNPETLVKVLPFVRRAIRLLETAQQSTAFGRDPSHSQYRGWRNTVAHWTASESVKFWWPWLAPLHSQEFADFVERKFDLSGVESLALEVRELELPAGFAWDRWPRRFAEPQPGSTRYGCFLDSASSDLLVGIAEVQTGAVEGSYLWHKNDIFIAPGLAAVEIRLRFLDQLLAVLQANAITVDCGPSPGPADISLYPRAGFRWESTDDKIAFVWQRPPS